MLAQKTMIRLAWAAVIFFISLLLLNILTGLWERYALYETVINNQLIVMMPVVVEAGEIRIFDNKNSSGEKILYHIELNHKNPEVEGYIQVREIDSPMELQLDEYKESADILDFHEKRIQANDSWGIQWDYLSANAASGEKYRTRRIFVERGNKMYVISLTCPESLWKKNQCDRIAESLSHSLKLLK